MTICDNNGKKLVLILYTIDISKAGVRNKRSSHDHDNRFKKFITAGITLLANKPVTTLIPSLKKLFQSNFN